MTNCCPQEFVADITNIEQTVVIGPNAKIASICGGGSCSLPPYYAITPYDGIMAKLDSKSVPYTVGAYSHKELPLLGPQVKTENGDRGVTFSVYNDDPSVNTRRCVDLKTFTQTDAMLMDYKVPGNTSGLWYADIEALLVPEKDGEYEFGLCVYGTANLYVDGKLIIDNKTKQRQGTVFFGCGTVEERGSISVKKGQTYRIKVVFASAVTNTLGTGGVIRFGGGAFRLGGAFKIDHEEEIRLAVELARGADQVVICAGLNVSKG